MMGLLSLILMLFLTPAQTPAAASVVGVGLTNAQEVVVQNPQFSGFIESRPDGSVLMFRQEKIRGEILLSTIQRIDLSYTKDGVFPLTVTLKNGEKLEVEANRRDFLTIRGRTELGSITINHPDPITAAVGFLNRNRDRTKDLTIRYLEFR